MGDRRQKEEKLRRLKLLAGTLALMAMVVVSSSPAMAYHDDCWAWDPWYGWYYVCDDDDDDWWGNEEDCWEWSDVFEEWQWDCD